MATKARKKPVAKPAKKRRGSPTGPPVRGRRGHSTVDQQAGLREYLVELYLERPKLTLEEKLEKIKATGYYISRASLARWGMAWEIEKARKDVIAEMARDYTSGDDSILEVETATSNLAQTKILEHLIENAGAEFDEKAVSLLTLFHRLQTSASARERAKLAFNRGVKSAVAQIREEMLKILRKDPETLRRVLRAIEQASEGAKR